MTREFRVINEAQTEVVGAEIAGLLPRSGVVYVRGDLGAGKTTLIRAIASALGADAGEVSSPTFAIVHEYDISNGRIVIQVPEHMGYPDGMSIDSEGMLWVAHWSYSSVVRWNRRGYCGVSFDRPIPPGDLNRWLGG